MILPDPPILVITNRMQCSESLENRAAALFRGGCRWLSLREKDMPADARLALLRRLIAVAADFGATVGVHGDIAAAESCGCALHLPAGAGAARARQHLGDKKLLGQSCHNAGEIAAAGAAGMDYATISPVFDSAGKPGYGPALATAGIASAVAGSEIAVLALGGVGLHTLPLLKGRGLAGVAMMGQAMTVTEPEAWFARIIAVWSSPTEGDS